MRYHEELEDIEKAVDEQALGILHLYFGRFKEAVIVSPRDLLSVVEHALQMYVNNTIISLHVGNYSYI